jgi:hypothetical protein
MMPSLRRITAGLGSFLVTMAAILGSPALVRTALAADSGATLAGYQAQALAAGGRWQFNSPGLLPLGDPAVGTIVEFDLPFARMSVDPGPVVDAMGSPVYPGDTAAHLGSALSTFGAPGVPNDPVLAEAQFPPAPGFKTSASFGSPSTAARPVTAESTASETGGKAASSITSFGLPGVFGVGASEASNAVNIGQTSVDSNATATLGTIDIAGLIQIAGTKATAGATSDGTTGKPSAKLEIGRVTVAGQTAFIDQDGIHLASSVLGSGLGSTVSDLLNKTLAGLGITVKTVSATLTHDGATATADSGALVITMTQHTPGILNMPGVPVIPLPAPLPAIGPGLPPITEQVVLLLGQAHASVNATLIPAFGGFGSTPGGGASGPSTSTSLPPSGPGASAPAALAALGPSSTTGGSTGAPQLATGPSFQTTPSRVVLGVPVRVAQILVALVGVIGGAAVLLGYARWQLLSGRSRLR